jgi:thiol-disulfide isomerase/thioredoxin
MLRPHSKHASLASWLLNRWLAVVAMSLLFSGVVAPSALGESGESLRTLDGSALKAEALEGDVILVFFASWSPRCRDVAERAKELRAKWGSRARVFLVAFQEGEEEVRDFLGAAHRDVDVLRDVDGSFSKRHGITTLPSLLVIEGGSVSFRGRLPSDADSVLRPIFG